MSNPIVTIEMEDGGIIDIELNEEAAPITCENFKKLVSEGFCQSRSIYICVRLDREVVHHGSEGRFFYMLRQVLRKTGSIYRIWKRASVVPRKELAAIEQFCPVI